MSPACWVSPACGLSATSRALDCQSPVTGADTKRNWSAVPVMPVPAADTLRVPLEVVSLPAAGLLMSWQVKPEGQLGSAGGVGGAGPVPNAYSWPLLSPT